MSTDCRLGGDARGAWGAPQSAAGPSQGARPPLGGDARSAWGAPQSAAGPSQGARTPLGGDARGAWGAPQSAAGPSQGARTPLGGDARSAWGAPSTAAGRSRRIAYTRPSITALETGYVADAAANGWGERCYDWLQRFEAGFAAHLGVRHAIATSSCTGALHLGLAALAVPGGDGDGDGQRHGIGPGDEVILADANWVASVAPVVHLGATPVFVDIRRDSWCLDADAVEAAITPRTRAIVAVHLYGNLCEMDRLLAVGARHGIPVVEDAAEAIGSVWHGGRRAGSLGAFGAFSFHGTKTMTTGEGGVFVTDDDALYERVLTLSNHGRARGQPKQFWPDRVGFKYKMSNLQAALGCAQLERVDELVARKRAVLRRYRELLEGCAGIAMNPEPAGTVNGAWMPTVVFDRATGVTRERLQAAFATADIDARVFFWPLSSTPTFGAGAGRPVAADIASRAINLPSFHDITDAEQQRVVDCIRQVLADAASPAESLPRRSGEREQEESLHG